MQFSPAFPGKGVFRFTGGEGGIIAFPSECWCLLVVPVGALWVLFGLGLILSGLWEVGGGGGGLVRSVWSRELGVRASPSGAYPAGRLQWHFTCGFDFTHGL